MTSFRTSAVAAESLRRVRGGASRWWRDRNKEYSLRRRCRCSREGTGTGWATPNSFKLQEVLSPRQYQSVDIRNVPTEIFRPCVINIACGLRISRCEGLLLILEDTLNGASGTTGRSRRAFVAYLRALNWAQLSRAQRDWIWIADRTGKPDDVWKRDQCSAELHRRVATDANEGVAEP